jgi:hypothetical protein
MQSTNIRHANRASDTTMDNTPIEINQPNIDHNDNILANILNNNETPLPSPTTPLIPEELVQCLSNEERGDNLDYKPDNHL